MLVTDTFYNVQCDYCGEMANEQWWNSASDAKYDANEQDYKALGSKHYCPDCYSYDDDDNIITKDGRKFDGETYEEITV